MDVRAVRAYLGLGGWTLDMGVKDMDEAIVWLKRCPDPHSNTCEVKIRPMFEPKDFIDSDQIWQQCLRIAYGIM